MCVRANSRGPRARSEVVRFAFCVTRLKTRRRLLLLLMLKEEDRKSLLPQWLGSSFGSLPSSPEARSRRAHQLPSFLWKRRGHRENEHDKKKIKSGGGRLAVVRSLAQPSAPRTHSCDAIQTRMLLQQRWPQNRAQPAALIDAMYATVVRDMKSVSAAACWHVVNSTRGSSACPGFD